MRTPSKTVLSAALSALLLTACGGSGSDSDLSGSNDWSLNPAGVSSYTAAATNFQGPISGLGSIVVNGVRFETSSASVYDPDSFDDSTLFGSSLGMGMTVALMGDADETQNLGRASKIRVVGGVRGTLTPTTHLDSTAKTLTFPTQVVTYSDTTVFSGTAGGNTISSLAQLQALGGRTVLLNVYGLPQADNSFLATRVVLIDPATHTMDVALRGKITAVAGSSYTVSVGATAITVDCAACTVQPLGSTAVVGDMVRVLATDSTAWSGGTLTATQLQLVSAYNLARFGGAASGFAKLKGVASNIGADWFVGGVQVTGVSGLVAGSFYEVRGTWSGNVLQASRWEAEGHDTHLDANGSSHSYGQELYGAISKRAGSSLVVQGVTVDASNAYVQNGSLASLLDNVFVEVKGTLNTSGVLVASKIEIKNASTSTSSAGMGRTFEVHGTVSQWLGSGSLFTLTDRRNSSVSAQTSSNTRFKNNLVPANGSLVELKGYMDTAGVFQVLSLEVDHDNGYHEED
jgi:hypothetical protein